MPSASTSTKLADANASQVSTLCKVGMRHQAARGVTAESCTAINAPASYNISVVSSTEWEDNSYSVVAVQTENECRMECLQDCNCEAAYYQVGLCNKQRLPLRYGRRDLRSSNVVLVK
ncbi:hypothetical protein CRG98_049599, partial [Punica granatum]